MISNLQQDHPPLGHGLMLLAIFLATAGADADEAADGSAEREPGCS